MLKLLASAVVTTILITGCQKETVEDHVKASNPAGNPTGLAHQDKDATAGMENAVVIIGSYTDSMAQTNQQGHKQYFDKLIHHNDSIFWHHHAMYSHGNEHDDHHHTDQGNTGTHDHHDHGTHDHGNHGVHNHDSLHVDQQHSQHHHSEHRHDNSDQHHEGHHIGQHEVLDSLHHVHNIHHPH